MTTTEPARRSNVALRVVVSLVAGAAVAWIGGLILGEYPFVGDGIQWLPILGGAGLGAAVAWVVNRTWKGAPPAAMAGAAMLLAVWGEVQAVQEDTPEGVAWPFEGWAAIVAAGLAAVYAVLAARRNAATGA